ncbi:hypothetical protein [Rhodococcus jostii]|uniref:hypothetical protein n=1 Tax=Rhodococcus jostii TaxID=132919 RepID=UPI00363B06DC
MTISWKISRLRGLVSASLIAAAAAGGLCTGSGISTADADTDAGVGTRTTFPDPAPDRWSIVNGTGQPIYGEMALTEWLVLFPVSSIPYSRTSVERPKDRPWLVGEHESVERVPSTPITVGVREGHICYDKQWWDYDTYPTLPFLHSSVGHLEVDSRGTLHLVEHQYDRPATTTRTPFKNTQKAC